MLPNVCGKLIDISHCQCICYHISEACSYTLAQFIQMRLCRFAGCDSIRTGHSQHRVCGKTDNAQYHSHHCAIYCHCSWWLHHSYAFLAQNQVRDDTRIYVYCPADQRMSCGVVWLIYLSTNTNTS